MMISDGGAMPRGRFAFESAFAEILWKKSRREAGENLRYRVGSLTHLSRIGRTGRSINGRKNSKRHERLKLTQHVHILKLSSLQTRIYNDSQKCV